MLKGPTIFLVSSLMDLREASSWEGGKHEYQHGSKATVRKNFLPLGRNGVAANTATTRHRAALGGEGGGGGGRLI